MNDYRINRDWSDGFAPLIAEIVGRHVHVPVRVSVAPIHNDINRNTDLLVLGAGPVRIACRIRRPEYLERYGKEFTIRAKLPDGSKTEIDKLMDGWGDYFFYGFAGADGKGLDKWFIADLNVFRRYYGRRIGELPPGLLPGRYQSNVDGSSDFLAFELKWMPPGFILAASWIKAKEAAPRSDQMSLFD